jgi:DNA-binding MltR family transcriptional regulator
MKPPLPLEHDDSEHNEQDREIIAILKELGKVKAIYPPEQLAARRTAFLAQADQLRAIEQGEESSTEDQEIVQLFGQLKSAQAEYPPELLAARRSAFVRQLEAVGQMSLLDRLRLSIQRIFSSKTTTPTLPPTGFRRLSPAIAGLVAALLIGALFLSRAEQALSPSPSQTAATPTPLSPTGSSDVAVLLCTPGDQMPACPSAELDPSQDLADPQNGVAQPAVSSQSDMDGVHGAASVNDGRSGASWVSKSADSWVKIDLGKVRTINSVTLQKGKLARQNDPGEFVIAVALSDFYADGDSRNDHIEYAQVFRSEQTSFSGSVADAGTILTQFPAVKARFVKITFEKAGAAIEEAGVFLMPPPVLAVRPTRKPPQDVPGVTAPPIGTNTVSLAESTTALPTDTIVSTLTNTLPSLDTSTPLPTITLLPTDTPIPVPTEPLPSDTPVPLPTEAPAIAITTTVQESPVGADPIVITGHDQTLTFMCNGNAVEIRGQANTVTLLGSCSSITVIGNRNYVLWEFGSPIITNQGKDNIISQP